MFERFSAQARQAVVLAVKEGKAHGTNRIGCGQLLIGLAQAGPGPAADALAAAGLDLDRIRELAPGRPPAEPLDADSLALVGIDLDQVRRSAEAAFGPGALDQPGRSRERLSRATMTADAKKALQYGLRSTHRAHDPALSAEHLLIGIIDQGDNAALRIMAEANVDPAALRADIVRRMTAAA
jgi:Clp amino terminal domain, pathogenicity island component